MGKPGPGALLLYREGLRLPDGAQQITTGVYCRPDFYYDPDVHVFCDRTPHDNPEVREMDEKRRQALRDRETYLVPDQLFEKLLCDLCVLCGKKQKTIPRPQ